MHVHKHELQDEQLRVQEEGLLNLAKSTLCIHWQTQAEGDCTFYLSEWKKSLRRGNSISAPTCFNSYSI